VEFTDDGIREIAALAGKANEQVENIGARRLHTIMTTLLEDVLFDAPDTLTARKILVNREMVQSRLAGIVQDTDLSKYIL